MNICSSIYTNLKFSASLPNPSSVPLHLLYVILSHFLLCFYHYFKIWTCVTLSFCPLFVCLCPQTLSYDDTTLMDQYI